ncbi:MAG: T9SS type A sorting domain-containing protein [Bacteroidales bacterium]|nr:T9SS type A sorting domain-containing protein [Bacteroidales bacterium]
MKKLTYLFSSALLGILFTLMSFSANAQTPYITVIQPNGGEQWVVGTTHLISWNDNLTKPVMIILSTDGINYSDTLTHSATGTTWTWDIPASQDTSSSCKIKIVSTIDNSISGTSSAYFALKGSEPADSNQFIQPNSGESWAAGTSHLISWTNYVTNSRLELSTDGGATYTTIAGADSIKGSTFTWNIPLSQDTSSFCMIKLVSRADTSVHTFSDSTFSIVKTPSDGVVHLFQPNESGLHWKRGTTHLVSWSDNFDAAVKIELLHADTLYSTLSSSTTDNGFAWTIADSVRIDTNYKIVVANILNTSISDTSNYSFSIDSVSASDTTAQRDTIVLVQPNGGNKWAVGTEHLISWFDNFSTPVKIELLSSDTVYSVLAASVSDANGFGWKIADSVPVGSNFKIKITSTADTAIHDVSDSAFSILATPDGGIINLIQPNGSEKWVKKQEYLISWNDNFTAPVQVELYNADTLYSILANNITDNRLAWTIPDSIPTGNNFKIKVFNTLNTAISDTSDNPFSILSVPPNGILTVNQPNGDEIWAKNYTYRISWMDNFSGPVKIELYHADTLYSTLSASAPDSSNSFAWKISDTVLADTNYSIKLISVDDPTVVDSSDSHFTIANHLDESITLVQPSDTGIQWAYGTKHLISWYSNFENPVRVELFHADTLYSVLDSSNTENRFTWDIPDTIPADSKYRIKVLNTADTAINDKSDTTFSVVEFVPGGFITMVQPDKPGIQWVRGKEYIISWTDNLKEPVDITLIDSTASGYTTTPIATDVPGSTYSWEIPSGTALGTKYKIVVSSSQQPISDTSSAYFSVVAFEPGGYIKVVQPNVPNIQWVRGKKYLISWTDNLSEPVNISLFNGDDSTTTALATDVEGSTYTWEIPGSLALGTKYKIEVSSSLQPISDISDTTFSVVAYEPGGFITVIQPSVSGIQWARGTEHLLSWTDNLKEPVNITLLDSTASGYVTTPIATNVEGSTYTWNISNSIDIGDKYKIVVSSTAQAISDTSEAYFSVVAFVPGGGISMEQPNGGEQWTLGNTYLVSWTDNLSEPVNISLTDGTDTTLIASHVEGTTYGWLVSDTLTPGSTYRIIVSSTEQPISAASAADFSLISYELGGEVSVVQPNGGEQWAWGSENLISWTRNFAYPLKVELMKADTVYTVLDDSTNGNSITWTVPDTLPVGTDYKIKVTNLVDTTVSDESDGYFSIATWPSGGFITVEQPNGGESWALGTGHLISWQGNLTGNYNIYLVHYDNSDAVDQTYTLATDVQPSTFTWNISSSLPASDHYRIRITGSSQVTIADSSDAYFTLAQPATIKAFPNPSTDYVTVRINDNTIQNYSVTVYNRFGNKVWSGMLNTGNVKELRLPTYNLPEGIYFVTLTNGSNRITKSIIVQH